jgi:hypothetical protein
VYAERQLPSRLLQGDEWRCAHLCHSDSKYHVICHWLRNNALADKHGSVRPASSGWKLLTNRRYPKLLYICSFCWPHGKPGISSDGEVGQASSGEKACRVLELGTEIYQAGCFALIEVAGALAGAHRLAGKNGLQLRRINWMAVHVVSSYQYL